MADRFRFIEDLELALASYSKHSIDEYSDEDVEEMEREYEDDEVNDVGKSEELLACPFCHEDFDVLELCCHVDADHRMEVKPGICPVCTMKVRINMASHVITEHESILKALCNKKHGSARSRSAMFLLRKDMQEKHLRCTMESPSVDSSFDAATDSMLLSFVNSPQHAYKHKTNEAACSTETSIAVESSNEDLSERIQTSLSIDGNNERSRRCEFVKGLVLSTMFDDL